MPDPSPPPVTPDQMAAYEKAQDDALAQIMGEDPDEPVSTPPEEPQDALSEEEAPEDEPEAEEGEEAQEGLLEEPEGEPAEEQPDPGYTEEQVHQAWLALHRDGWSQEELANLSEEKLVARGLARRVAQVENDRAYSDRDQLEKLLKQLKPTESTEGQAGAGHPEQGAGDPASTGADLASEALPVVQKLSEMDDPKEIAPLLASFVEKAVKASMPQPAPGPDLNPLQVDLIRREARRELGPDFEGDLIKLEETAAQLGAAGLHSDKQGLARYVSLIRAAQSLSDAPVRARTNSSTSRARRRGAAPPVSGRKTPPKQRSGDEILEAKIGAILDGETDVSKLRGMR